MDAERVNQLEDQRHDAVMGAIHGVHERLDTLNGRTRKLENQMSVIQWAYAAGGAVLSFVTYKLTGQPPPP